MLPTGEFAVEGFTIGWGNDVIELRDVVIGQELAESFKNLYTPGTTGRLSFKLNNYVLVEENAPTEEVAPPSHGFGSEEKIEANVITKYVRSIEIIGGDIPFFGTKEYTEEEIVTAKQVRALKLQTMSSPANDTPPQTNTGFGAGSEKPSESNEQSPPFSDNETPPPFDADMPDF